MVQFLFYKIIFLSGEYDFVEKISQDGVKIRVYTPPNKSKQVKLLLLQQI